MIAEYNDQTILGTEIITMLKFSNGAVGTIEASRNAYGRNNFLTFEIHGRRMPRICKKVRYNL